MAVIAMTRELGTLGGDVAAGLSKRLGLNLVNTELVEHDIAGRTGMSDSEVHRFLEGEASFVERWKIDRKRFSRHNAEEVYELAARGNVLLRGWGAAYLLRRALHVICVRICAPLDFREEVLMERGGIDDRALARREIEHHDAAHNAIAQSLFGIDRMDASLYAIVLNTGRIPTDKCIEQIEHLTECPSFEETPESRRALQDNLIEARVRDALERQFGSGVFAQGFDVTVSSGKVTLTGATTDEHLIVDAIRCVHGVEGVVGVHSKIAHVAFQRSTEQ